MKNIAVLVYELTIEYNATVLNGIVDFFAQKNDVRLFISPVNVPKSTSAEFDYQYWSSVDVLCSEEIDAYIIITNSFSSYLTTDQLSEYLKVLAPKPVISVSVPLNVENNYYTCVSCEDAYDKIVEHLVKKHNKTKIGFFTAAQTFSSESEVRFNAYKNALKKNGLEFNEEFVFHGDFTPGVAERVFLERIKSKDDIKFEALLCANDYTAVGVLTAFNTLGVKCPEDVCLVGFDDTEIATHSFPTLSTINQSVEETGAGAARVAYDILRGIECERKIEIPAEPVYRQSCGCVPSTLQDGTSYDNNGELRSTKYQNAERQRFFAQGSSNFTTIFELLNAMDTSISFEAYLNNLLYNFRLQNIYELSIVLYKEPVELEKDETFIVPDDANFIFHSNKTIERRNLFLGHNQIRFNPREELIPRRYSDILPGKFLVLPIYNKTNNYGYIVALFQGHNYPLISIYGKILANSLFQAYANSQNITKRKELMLENQKLNIKSKTDELTGVLNRRGFYDYGQKLASLSSSMGKTGSVMFFDLDGLKTINDTYGHKIGDLAIKVEAQVLKAAFRESDVVGRISGDEFGVVAPGFPSEKVSALREKLISLNEDFSKKNELPFTLSISVGAVDFNVDNHDIQLLLKVADENLYQEKRIKHSQK